MSRCTLKPLAYKRNLEWWILVQRSYKILNKICPKVEPCGATDNTEKGEESFPKEGIKEGRSS
jgi:hypothetical protein